MSLNFVWVYMKSLSSSTLNNTKDDSSYVLPPDTSLDQSSELCTNIEDETTENLEDTEDNESVIEELIKKSNPPKLDDLEVPRAGEETKKSFCCFCFHSFVVISRHYEAIHSDEKEVQHFLSLKKRSTERIAAIEKLRLKGTQLFNLNNDFNHGRLLVTRQPQKTSLANVHDFKPCHKCGRWLQYINRHKCPYGKESNGDRSDLIKSKILMGQICNNATSLTRKILAINNDDSISEAVRQDPLLITFVNELSQKYTNPHQHSMIR
ncbi:Protein of unknown function [Cotesia congregata]|uniref:Uncharacterized protein n=1 Tax=Cotesia congregata TaxID=51543 RepID=A0A8J2HQF8_COTCN|nr:Protein of unknown function [Cotesia congregata]